MSILRMTLGGIVTGRIQKEILTEQGPKKFVKYMENEARDIYDLIIPTFFGLVLAKIFSRCDVPILSKGIHAFILFGFSLQFLNFFQMVKSFDHSLKKYEVSTL